MEQKTKFILIGLIGITLIFAFLWLQALSSKQLLVREGEELKSENSALSNKLDKLEANTRSAENKISSLSRELDKISREKADLQKQYESALQAKDELAQKLKTQATQVRPESMQAAMAPANQDAYWAGILKAKTDLEMQLANVRSELKSIQIINEQLQREKSTLQLDITNFKRENEDAKRQLDYNQKLMDSIAQELVRERNDKILIQDSIKTLKNENAALTRQIKSLNNRKIDLEKKLQELAQDKTSVENKFMELETLLSDKISQINNLKEELDAIHSGTAPTPQRQEKESVELPPIVVRPQAQLQAQAESAMAVARILAINRENNFVVIDLGEDAGVRVGDNFQVYREDSVVGTIQVVKTSKSVAACDITKEITPVKIGDTVR